ncbi:hypothetical protein Ddc_04906 [Ditylenchus destructor]|nr:hypothetical protein Ddc_04906 [Ditylenchus destructor]
MTEALIQPNVDISKKQERIEQGKRTLSGAKPIGKDSKNTPYEGGICQRQCINGKYESHIWHYPGKTLAVRPTEIESISRATESGESRQTKQDGDSR